MVRSCFGKIKDIKAATQQSVPIFSRTKRPRHIDRTSVALSYLSGRHKLQWFPRREVLQTVLEMHEKSGDPKPIGPLIEPYVEDSLPALAHAGYIEIDERNQMVCISECAAGMMNHIDEQIQDAEFRNALEELFAHCNVYRQLLGSESNKTKKELIAEIKALIEANATLKSKLSEALAQYNSSQHNVASLPQPSDGNAEIEDSDAHLPGPSAPFQGPNIYDTPLPLKVSENSEVAYPTPTSLHRLQGSFRISVSPPPSPTPLSRQHTLQYQTSFEMDVDNDIPQAPINEASSGNWRFGDYLRNFVGILSLPVGPRKHSNKDHQALVQGLQQEITTESENHHKLVKSLGDCRRSLKAANATIKTQEDALREKNALIVVSAEKISRLNQDLVTEQSSRQKAEADAIEVRGQYQNALETIEKLRVEAVTIKSRLFRSELRRRKLLIKSTKLEKKLRKMDHHDDEFQSLITQVKVLKEQIEEDQGKALDLAQKWQRREDELNREVESCKSQAEEYQETFNRFYNVFQDKRHLWPSSQPSSN